jgi:hypothetical protein
MPVSAKSLHARGLISDRQMKLHALKGTRSEPSKMAPFEHKDRDEGKLGNRGTLTTKGHINSRATQKTPSRFKASKGGRVNNTGQLHKGLIDEAAAQGPKFPAGGKARGKLTKPSKLKGTRSQKSAVVYDTPSRN